MFTNLSIFMKVIFSEGKDLQSVDDCLELLTLFDKVLPATQDSLMQWETRISYRYEVCVAGAVALIYVSFEKFLCYRTACLNHMPDEVQSEAFTSGMKMQLSLIEVALQQGNQNFAKKYLTDIKKRDRGKV